MLGWICLQASRGDGRPWLSQHVGPHHLCIVLVVDADEELSTLPNPALQQSLQYLQATYQTPCSHEDRVDY